MNIQALLPKVVKIAKSAGVFLLERQSQVKVIDQDYKDIVTDADLASDSFIRERLQEITPNIPIASEEDEGGVGRFEGRKWVVDPLDGTFNFSTKDLLWGVSIALVENKQSQLGVVSLPCLNETIGVIRQGEVIANTFLRVRSDRDLSKAPVWVDWRKGDNEVTFFLLRKIEEKALYPGMKLCVTGSLMAVATGKIAAYFHPGPGPEDIAAGCLIVEKAGGKVTDFAGQPWTPFSNSILASNGILHEQLLELISS